MRGTWWCLLLVFATGTDGIKSVPSRLPRTSAGQLAAAAAAQNKTIHELRNSRNVTSPATVGTPPGRGSSSRVRTYNLDGIKAIQWGRTHEKNGIEFLKTSLSLDIQSTGIWLTKSGLLGASPDGLVGDDSIVEVKCPYSYRNDQLSQTLKSSNQYIIHYITDNEIVNKNHNYYHQIQGNLHILKRSKCYLCIWTLKEVTAVVIEYDPLWAENLSLLEDFYIKQYLPKLIHNLTSAET